MEGSGPQACLSLKSGSPGTELLLSTEFANSDILRP